MEENEDGNRKHSQPKGQKPGVSTKKLRDLAENKVI